MVQSNYDNIIENIYVISGLRVTNKVEKLQVIKGRTYTLLVLVYSWDLLTIRKDTQQLYLLTMSQSP